MGRLSEKRETEIRGTLREAKRFAKAGEGDVRTATTYARDVASLIHEIDHLRTDLTNAHARASVLARRVD